MHGTLNIAITSVFFEYTFQKQFMDDTSNFEKSSQKLHSNRLVIANKQ